MFWKMLVNSVHIILSNPLENTDEINLGRKLDTLFRTITLDIACYVETLRTEE